MVTPAPKQTIASMLSGSVHTYRRNFAKLYLIFALSFILMLLPVLFNLDTIVTQLHEAVKDLDGTTVVYTVIYIFMPMLRNGFLVGAFASIWIIGIFGTPFFMGMAGKIALDDEAGKPCTLAQAARWTLGHYKHLLFAYALYYVIFLAYAIGFLALLYWLIWKASHLITDAWLDPIIALCIGSGLCLFLGTVYLPFVAMEEKRGSFRSYLNSFRAMYSKNFIHSFPRLLLAALLAGGVSFAVLFPVAPPLFLGHQGNAMMFLSGYSNVLITLLVSIAVFSLVGVFLYIFAYNTYRNAGAVSYRRETADRTYRRKLNFVEPTFRRRIG